MPGTRRINGRALSGFSVLQIRVRELKSKSVEVNLISNITVPILCDLIGLHWTFSAFNIVLGWLVQIPMRAEPGNIAQSGSSQIK